MSSYDRIDARYDRAFARLTAIEVAQRRAARPAALPFEHQQLDAVDIEGMTLEEIGAADRRGQLRTLKADPGHVNPDRLIGEEDAKDDAANKAAWVRAEQSQRALEAKANFRSELAEHNEARAARGLKPIPDLPTQFNKDALEVMALKGPDAVMAAQAKGHLIEMTSGTAGDYISGFEKYEASQITSTVERARYLMASGDFNQQREAAQMLSELTSGQLGVARENGVGVDPAAAQRQVDNIPTGPSTDPF